MSDRCIGCGGPFVSRSNPYCRRCRVNPWQIGNRVRVQTTFDISQKDSSLWWWQGQVGEVIKKHGQTCEIQTSDGYRTWINATDLIDAGQEVTA